MTHVRDTTPYAWPFDGDLPARRVAHLVCGVDARWAGTDRAELGRLLSAFAADLARAAVPTIVIHHGSGDRTGLWATPAGAREITAAGIDGFYGSPLDDTLRRLGRDRLLLTGFGLETAVHSTLRSANDRGYECLTISDLCCAVDPACLAGALSAIEMSGGIFGAIGRSDAVQTILSPPNPGG